MTCNNAAYKRYRQSLKEHKKEIKKLREKITKAEKDIAFHESVIKFLKTIASDSSNPNSPLYNSGERGGIIDHDNADCFGPPTEW